jgi:hypothetical protein
MHCPCSRDFLPAVSTSLVGILGPVDAVDPPCLPFTDYRRVFVRQLSYDDAPAWVFAAPYESEVFL